MKTVRLGTIAGFVMGQAPPGVTCNKEKKGTPFVKAGQFGEERPVIEEWTTKPLKKAKEGDVLVCVVGATSGKLNLGANCAIGRSVAAIRPKLERLDQKYLYYYLQTWTLRLRSGSRGSAQGVITRRMLSDLQIPLPPLPVQRRIAAVLDKADALRQKRRRALAKLDDLLQAVFLDMFGDPVTNPKGWPVVKLGKLCSKVTDGTHKTPKYVNEGVIFISARNVTTDGRIDWSDVRYITPEEHNQLIKRCDPQKGDIVLTKSGSLGTAALINIDFEFSLFESLALLKFLPNTIKSEFVLQLLNSEAFKRLYKMNTKGIAIKHLHLVDIRGLPIIAPPIELQKRFVERRLLLMQRIASHEQALSLSDTLFNALMQKAFTGEGTFAEAAPDEGPHEREPLVHDGAQLGLAL